VPRQPPSVSKLVDSSDLLAAGPVHALNGHTPNGTPNISPDSSLERLQIVNDEKKFTCVLSRLTNMDRILYSHNATGQT